MLPDEEVIDVRAIHEAGHGFVASCSEPIIEFERITIAPPKLWRPRRSCRRDSMRLALGGPIAEFLHTGAWAYDAAGYDLMRVVALADDEHEIESAVREVGDLLVARWPAVAAIARVLVEVGELSQCAVALIVRTADAAGIEAPHRPWTVREYGPLLAFIADLRGGRRVWIPNAAPVLT